MPGRSAGKRGGKSPFLKGTPAVSSSVVFSVLDTDSAFMQIGPSLEARIVASAELPGVAHASNPRLFKGLPQTARRKKLRELPFRVVSATQRVYTGFTVGRLIVWTRKMSGYYGRHCPGGTELTTK